MEIGVVPMREITDARFDRTGFDELSHRPPSISWGNLGDALGLGRFVEKRDDHRLPFAPPDAPNGPRPTFLEHTSDCQHGLFSSDRIPGPTNQIVA
jgi:hypothetical protein